MKLDLLTEQEKFELIPHLINGRKLLALDKILKECFQINLFEDYTEHSDDCTTIRMFHWRIVS